MQTLARSLLVLVAVVLLQSTHAVALSVAIDRDINFPAHFDPAKRLAILQVVQDKSFDFGGGIVSHWPPDWGTRLSYTGDADALVRFMKALHSIHGMEISVFLYRGRDDEGRHDSAWQLDFSQAHSDRLTVYLNLNSKSLDWEKVKLPDMLPVP